MRRGGSAPLLGNLLVVGSVLAWAIYTVQSKHLSSVYPWLVVTTASIGVGVIPQGEQRRHIHECIPFPATRYGLEGEYSREPSAHQARF